MKRVLITGANRGLGLEFARQYLARGDRVFAGVRQPERAAALKDLAVAHPDRLSIITLDVAIPDSIAASWHDVREQVDGLELLINNAGINSHSRDAGDPDAHRALGQLDADRMLYMFRVNAVAPVLVAQRYLDLLKAGHDPRIVNISSGVGSLAGKANGGNYSYAASKAALNMLTRALAFDVIADGIVAVAINPGWVQTDMGGPGAHLTPAESVWGILQLVDELTDRDAGRFLDWKGIAQPW